MSETSPAIVPVSNPETAPEGFALFYYVRQAVQIIFWDDEAVRKAAKDPGSLPYGLAFWAFANLLQALFLLGNSHGPHTKAGLRTITLILMVLPVAAVFELARIGTCHLIANWFFAADGRFVELLRPLLLGSLILVLAVIPYAGAFIAGIGFVAVLCLAFQEVNHVEPLQSYILCIVVSIVFRLIEGRIVGGGI